MNNSYRTVRPQIKRIQFTNILTKFILYTFLSRLVHRLQVRKFTIQRLHIFLFKQIFKIFSIQSFQFLITRS